MSAQLDALGLTGNNTDPNPQGLYPQLTATDPIPATLADWEAFVSAAATGIDSGPWAESLAEVRYCVNNDAMVLAETTFQVGGGNQATAGEMSAAAYLRGQSAGFYSSSRMPATASDRCGRYHLPRWHDGARWRQRHADGGLPCLGLHRDR